MTDTHRPPLRVLMVEDYSQYYEGLRFELQPHVLLDNAPDTATAQKMLADNHYDAVLLDLALPPTHTTKEGLGLAEKIASDEERNLPVIIVTSKDTDAALLRKLMGWRISMIHKDDRPSGAEVEYALRLVLRGYFLLSRLPAGDLPDLATQPSASSSADLFKERDFAIFKMLAEEGCTNLQIAYRLGIKEDAVKKGVQRIFRRTGVASRAEAVRWWFEHKDELGLEQEEK
jgi:DNA-binding NarL/FixJ family response regulator